MDPSTLSAREKSLIEHRTRLTPADRVALRALRQAHGGTILADYRKQFEPRVQPLPFFAHVDRLPADRLKAALDAAPLTCFVLHRSNEEVKRAVLELHYDEKWTRPTLWFTGEVDQVGSLRGMPVVPRALLDRVLLPLLMKHHTDGDGFELMLDAVAYCRDRNYTYGHEAEFAQMLGME